MHSLPRWGGRGAGGGEALSLSEGFSCFKSTETRVREITRHRVKQINKVYSSVFLAVAWERGNLSLKSFASWISPPNMK